MKKYAALCNKLPITLMLICMNATLHAGETSQQLEPSHWFHQDHAQDLVADPDNNLAPFNLKKDTFGYRIRLLKKLADWHQQHTNGLTMKLAPNVAAQLNSALDISFLIEAKHTDIPSSAQLRTWYQNKFGNVNLADFDDSQAHILLTFWTKPDADQGIWRKDYLLSIAPSEWGKPLSFKLPLTDFICSYELNYQRTVATDQTACRTENWQELTVVNETRNQNVLRNINGVAFENQTVPEHYRTLQLRHLQLSIVSDQTND